MFEKEINFTDSSKRSLEKLLMNTGKPNHLPHRRFSLNKTDRDRGHGVQFSPFIQTHLSHLIRRKLVGQPRGCTSVSYASVREFADVKVLTHRRGGGVPSKGFSRGVPADLVGALARKTPSVSGAPSRFLLAGAGAGGGGRPGAPPFPSVPGRTS